MQTSILLEVGLDFTGCLSCYSCNATPAGQCSCSVGQDRARTPRLLQTHNTTSIHKSQARQRVADGLHCPPAHTRTKGGGCTPADCTLACWPTLLGHEGCTALHQPNYRVCASSRGSMRSNAYTRGACTMKATAGRGQQLQARQRQQGWHRSNQTTQPEGATRGAAHQLAAKGEGRELPTAADARQHICGAPTQPPSQEEGGCPNNSMT